MVVMFLIDSSVGFAETLEAELPSLCNKGIDALIAFGGGRVLGSCVVDFPLVNNVFNIEFGILT